MMRTVMWWSGALGLAMLFVGPMSKATADPGLLLIAHGSPRSEWNKPVLELGRKVAEEAIKSGRFKAVRTAMMEMAEPRITTALAELEAAGCDRVVAVPLFTAPGKHTLLDIPVVLGIRSSPEISAELAEEGTKPYRPAVPVVLAQTLDEGGLLAEYLLRQVRELSRSPADEAIVVLVHGDPDHQPPVDRLLRRLTTRCCGAMGIDDGSWAYIGVGQRYSTNGVAAIREAADRKSRVLVVGLYLASAAKSLHVRALRVERQRQPEFDPLRGKDVVFSDLQLVEHPGLVAWVLEAAKAALPEAPRGAVQSARPIEATR